jgi:hypothetical protein
MAAWRRSQLDKEVLTVEEAGEADKSRPRRTRRTEGQAGDSALLEKALKAQQAICELKGLNAPKQTELLANLEALSVHEEIITIRQNPTPPDPSELPGLVGEPERLCGGTG